MDTLGCAKATYLLPREMHIHTVFSKIFQCSWTQITNRFFHDDIAMPKLKHQRVPQPKKNVKKAQGLSGCLKFFNWNKHPFREKNS